MPPAFHTLRVADIRPAAPDAVAIAFDVPPALASAYAFVPGQYVTLRATIDGREARRSYSICSAPGAPLRVGIKRAPGGLFSNWAADALRPGDPIDVMTPDGRFVLPPADGRPRVLAAFAAGSGITPILAIAAAALESEPGTEVFLFAGNRSTASIMFREEIEDLKDRHPARLSVFHALSREAQDLPALNGRLDAAKIGLLLRTVLPAAAIDHAFVCGPQPMIEDAAAALRGAGVPDARVRVERFTPSADARPAPPPPRPDAPPACVATAIHDGARFDFPVAAGEALIDAALRAGRDLPFSCKGGMCCTCRARVVEGAGEMLANYSLEPWEAEAGFALACQLVPTTARIVVDFDAA